MLFIIKLIRGQITFKIEDHYPVYQIIAPFFATYFVLACVRDVLWLLLLSA